MHVKYVLLAMAASGAAFYSAGRYGHDVDLASPAAIRQAMALGGTPQTQAPSQIAQAPANPPVQAPAQPGPVSYTHLTLPTKA